MLEGRAVIVKRLKTVPLEAVVRGYVIGSGWKDYQKTGAISGIKLPAGLKQAAKLPQTLFTPSTKAAIGDKDETISFRAGGEPRRRRHRRSRARHRHRDLRVRVEACALSAASSSPTPSSSLLRVPDGKLVLIDEVLTPDSSRFWPADT